MIYKLITLYILITQVYGQDSEVSDADACVGESLEGYNLGMRVGALFIILGTSSLGVFAPMILHRISVYSKNSIRAWILTVGKFFGTGVILATAFVHMLPDSFEQFASPCLTSGWLSYGAFAGVFCMIASFSLQLLELSAISHIKKIMKSNQQKDLELSSNSISDKSTSQTQVTHHHVHTGGFLEEDGYGNIGTIILELGIVMHSIIIGITLATTSADEFTTLLIAIVFHQFFEGIALGTRLNELKNVKWLKVIIMGIVFSITTPIGVAIGIGIRSSFNANSYSAVLSSAILDSLSAGILLYNAYVSLISGEINHSSEFHDYSFFKKSICFISMYIGAGLMSLIGEWA
ncbi:Zinc/iron permease [Cunninghamella echinulata]|nr:Zinc/iron permease [Cunninghamella echinulata]